MFVSHAVCVGGSTWGFTNVSTVVVWEATPGDSCCYAISVVIYGWMEAHWWVSPGGGSLGDTIVVWVGQVSPGGGSLGATIIVWVV